MDQRVIPDGNVFEQPLDRRTLLRSGVALGVGLTPAAAILTACRSEHSDSAAGPLSRSFQTWILNLHPAIEQSVDAGFSLEHPRTPLGPPVSASISSETDLYVGMTPFIDMTRLAKKGTIEPWNGLMPKRVMSDLMPKLREEGSIEDKLYNWPFLVDVVVQGWNAGLVERAGLDPGDAPASWDEYIENSRRVVRLGAAPYGCTFDARPWRSLVPIAFSIRPDVFFEEGLFDFKSDSALEALQILKRMGELANPDVLDTATVAGSGLTTDEVAFASQLVGYYVKYQNAHIRAAGIWPDPGRLALGPIPKTPRGTTLFWSTGIALIKGSARKPAATRYAEALTYGPTVWEESLGGGRRATGQLPPYRSLWTHWKRQRPAWLEDWALQLNAELSGASPIRAHRLGARQFVLAKPYLDRYLNGDERNPRRALSSAMESVRRADSKLGP
jgi:multiple sugar transport system substrate-binding protein